MKGGKSNYSTKKAQRRDESELSEEEREKMIKIIVKKVLKYNETSATDLPELLDMLDKGYDVNISDYGDEYMKHKLYKLFKLFELSHDSKNKYIFRKRQDIALLLKSASTMKAYTVALINELKAGTVTKPSSHYEPAEQLTSKRVCVRPAKTTVLPEVAEDEEEAWLKLEVENDGKANTKAKAEKVHEPQEALEEEVTASAKGLFEEHKIRMRKLKKLEEKQRRLAGKFGVSFSQNDACL